MSIRDAFHGRIIIIIEPLHKHTLPVQMLRLQLFFPRLVCLLPPVLGQQFNFVLEKFHLLFKAVSECFQFFFLFLAHFFAAEPQIFRLLLLTFVNLREINPLSTSLSKNKHHLGTFSMKNIYFCYFKRENRSWENYHFLYFIVRQDFFKHSELRNMFAVILIITNNLINQEVRGEQLKN